MDRDWQTVASVVWFLGCGRHMDIDFHYSSDWSAYITDAKDLPEPQLIDDDNEVKLLMKNRMH